jgi:hypothetical protein
MEHLFVVTFTLQRVRFPKLLVFMHFFLLTQHITGEYHFSPAPRVQDAGSVNMSASPRVSEGHLTISGDRAMQFLQYKCLMAITPIESRRERVALMHCKHCGPSAEAGMDTGCDVEVGRRQGC